VSVVRKKRCEGDHTVTPILLHLTPPVALKEFMGGSPRGKALLHQ